MRLFARFFLLFQTTSVTQTLFVSYFMRRLCEWEEKDLHAKDVVNAKELETYYLYYKKHSEKDVHEDSPTEDSDC